MSVGALVVLIVIGVLTVGLSHYALAVMPRRFRERERSTLKVFSTAVELRFPGHMGLTDRVVALSGEVGRTLGLNEEQLQRLEKAARLRDIGLCAIPWKLVNHHNPLQWTAQERATYDKHSEVSGAMLELVPSLRDLAPIARYHHTAFDGSYGPTAPAGQDLPIESRVIAVVDEFVGRERFQGPGLARSFLLEESGKRFDPAVVEVFLRVLPSARDAQSPEPVAFR